MKHCASKIFRCYHKNTSEFLGFTKQNEPLAKVCIKLTNMNASVIVVDYGMGNIHSILKALRLYLSDVRYSKDISEIREAAALVLPGDGAFAAAMQGLQGEIGAALRERVQAGVPLLGICIGFQVLFQDSDEVFHTGGASLRATRTAIEQKENGLAFLKGNIRRFHFENGTRIPHMGWNQLIPPAPANKLRFKNLPPITRQYMYFIHSYRAEQVMPDCIAAYCDYAGDIFPAIVQHKNITAFQFHPEKSGVAGLEFIKSWATQLTALSKTQIHGDILTSSFIEKP